MIKKLPVMIGLLGLCVTGFSQENSEKIYWYTSSDTDGYISFQQSNSNTQNKINTVVKANFDSEVLNFSLSTSCESDKMVIANEFKFDGTIDSNIEPVKFTGTKIKTDSKDISFWHFKGDFVDEMDPDPDVQRFTFAKYNATLKIPARTIPSFNLWAIIPKLPFDRKGTFKFNALDETKLYVMKNQTVNYLGTTKIEIGGKEMKLHKFVHQGKGMKPAYYWVNDQRELMQVFLDEKYTFTLSSKDTALQTAMLSKSEE